MITTWTLTTKNSPIIVESDWLQFAAIIFQSEHICMIFNFLTTSFVNMIFWQPIHMSQKHSNQDLCTWTISETLSHWHEFYQIEFIWQLIVPMMIISKFCCKPRVLILTWFHLITNIIEAFGISWTLNLPVSLFSLLTTEFLDWLLLRTRLIPLFQTRDYCLATCQNFGFLGVVFLWGQI